MRTSRSGKDIRSRGCSLDQRRVKALRWPLCLCNPGASYQSTWLGQVEVLSVIACHDVGKAVNPAGVIGQIEGESPWIGHTLMEKCWSRTAQSRIWLRRILCSTAMDIPDVTQCGSRMKNTPVLRGEGIGEPALLPLRLQS